MSFTFLLAAGEESSADNFSDIPACVLSNLNLTGAKHSCNASETESCHASRSGMTCGHSTERRGVEKLTRFAADFRAKILAVPEAGQVLKTANEADCGEKWHESYAKWNPELSSWRTRQFSLLGGLEPFLETWPRWGSMHDGECYPLPMPSGLKELRAWITYASESGFSQNMPTPCERDYKDTGKNTNYEALAKKGKLAGAVVVNRRLPTITKFDATGGELNGKEYNGQSRHAMKLIQGIARLPSLRKSDADRGGRGDLIQAVRGNSNKHFKSMPTVTKSDASGGPGRGKNRTGGDNLRTEVGGALNADWTEWLMGWPTGFSALAPLAMDKYRQWLRSHGVF